jgi:phenylacetate-CoA ligase
MLLVRGTNVYPRAIESIIRSYAQVDEFQILVESVNHIDEITVRTELRPDAQHTWSELQGKLERDLKEHHEMLRFNVELAEPNTLPRFELKARRVLDKRRKG